MNANSIFVAGLAALASGWALQKAYKVTNFYPPQPVFWFAIGATAYIGVSLAQKRGLLRG